jgi:hypothetical protein
LLAAISMAAVALIIGWLEGVSGGWRGVLRLGRHEEPPPREIALPEKAHNRQRLFAAVQPARLANCDFQRFGEPNDGGYLLCGNLLESVEVAYSYGINGYDGWGCDVSRLRGLRVHQYDCFEIEAPLCPGGDAVFHAECIGPSARVIDGRPFDTLDRQIARNGDAARHLVVKMDVEGAEWEVFRTAPDSALEQIDQLAVEFHGTQEDHFIEAMARLSGFFHVASLHFNNFSCDPRLAPFPAWAYEVLLVNKRIGVLHPDGGSVTGLDRLTAPNFAAGPDCQADGP